jgi:hypothetical protein
MPGVVRRDFNGILHCALRDGRNAVIGLLSLGVNWMAGTSPVMTAESKAAGNHTFALSPFAIQLINGIAGSTQPSPATT